MTTIKRLIITTLATTLLNSCMFTFNNYQNNRVEYRHPPCNEIFAELEYANHFEQQLQSQNKFMLRYMLVIPAIIQTYRLHYDQRIVARRKAELKHAAEAQNCYGNNPINTKQGASNTRAYVPQHKAGRSIYETDQLNNNYQPRY